MLLPLKLIVLLSAHVAPTFSLDLSLGISSSSPLPFTGLIVIHFEEDITILGRCTEAYKHKDEVSTTYL